MGIRWRQKKHHFRNISVPNNDSLEFRRPLIIAYSPLDLPFEFLDQVVGRFQSDRQPNPVVSNCGTEPFFPPSCLNGDVVVGRETNIDEMEF
jgi:hypothetical protein